eukprot:COSAG05_NODE_1502_length_4696_cov_15.115945_4_plen_260_part_00
MSQAHDYAALDQSVEAGGAETDPMTEDNKPTDAQPQQKPRLTFKKVATLTYTTQVLRRRGRLHQLMKTMRAGALVYSGIILAANSSRGGGGNMGGDSEDEDNALRRALSTREQTRADSGASDSLESAVTAKVPERAPRPNIILAVVSTNAFLVLCCNTMFLPALQDVQKELDTTPSLVALAITTYMLASAFQPLLVGPVADVVGRQKPMIIAHFVFVAASVGAALAPTVEALIAARVLEGMAACTFVIVGQGQVSLIRG